MNESARFTSERYSPNPAPEVGAPQNDDNAAAVAFPLKWHGDDNDAPLKSWLVDKTLPKIGTALLAGQWGIYKTFAALDLAGAVMAKTSFARRAINRQGGVLFIAAEGQDEIRVRLEGIAREKAGAVGPDGAPLDPARMPFAWIDACPHLTGDNALDELGTIVGAAARGMKEKFGLPLALVIIDTLMPAAGFKDANDAAEAQRVMNLLNDIARKAEALVVAVDHFGKDVTTGTRNSSAKEGAVDAVLALLAERDLAGAVSNPRLAIRKVRGAPTGQEIPFHMRTVTVYENTEYDAITTLVVDWADVQLSASAEQPKAKGWPKSLVIFHHALDKTIGDLGKSIRPFLDGPEVLAATREQVRTEFLKTYPADELTAKRQAFRRCERAAVSSGLIVSREIGPPESAATFFWPTKATNEAR
jgi:AAA domain